jgi:hypothetical protein
MKIITLSAILIAICGCLFSCNTKHVNQPNKRLPFAIQDLIMTKDIHPMCDSLNDQTLLLTIDSMVTHISDTSSVRISDCSGLSEFDEIIPQTYIPSGIIANCLILRTIHFLDTRQYSSQESCSAFFGYCHGHNLGVAEYFQLIKSNQVVFRDWLDRTAHMDIKMRLFEWHRYYERKIACCMKCAN